MVPHGQQSEDKFFLRSHRQFQMLSTAIYRVEQNKIKILDYLNEEKYI